MKKLCRRCFKEKELSEFYRHKEMFDGHLNICKECVKSRVGKHREENIEKIREYDRERGKLPHRIRLTSEGSKRRRKANGIMYFAQTKIGNSIRDKKIDRPSHCSWCGNKHNKIEGHHEDYSKPLDVIWLCSPCHKKLHLGKTKEAEALREKIKIPF